MELNNTAPGSPSIRCFSEARISIQSLPLSPPPSPLSNPTAESTKKDATSGGHHDLVPCLVVDLRLKVEEDTVIECQSTKLSSVSNSSTEKICRICHVSSGCAGNSSELIDLGCGCKNGLSVTHQHCAETWFKIKGNRCCEICGSNVRNITGFGRQEFMDIWHDGREVTMQDNQNSLSERRNRRLRSQLFCGFFITCLLVAFIVPWFFRLSMF
ncbi:uncharacterized protein LOC144546949 [Carex rostrata]